MATFGLIRAQFISMVPMMFNLGFSSNRMIRQCRTVFGGAYRRQTMLQDINEIVGRKTKQYFVERLERTVIPHRSDMVETYLRSASRYRVFGNATYVNIKTNEERMAPMSMYSDRLQTLDTWEEMYGEEVEKENMYEGEVFMGINFTSIEHQAGSPY